jgi:hypothetical protein
LLIAAENSFTSTYVRKFGIMPLQYIKQVFLLVSLPPTFCIISHCFQMTKTLAKSLKTGPKYDHCRKIEGRKITKFGKK